MPIYDESFAAAMVATQREATRLGADAYGSEHVLLGLLAGDVPPGREIARAFPGLTPGALGAAAGSSADDLPHLQRLGIAPGALPPAPRPGRVPPRNRHRPELQASLNSASAKLNRLLKDGSLPRSSTPGSAVLWLAVLEPTARAARLLAAMGLEPDAVRAEVLRALCGDGRPLPEWPDQAPPLGVVTRLAQRLLSRANVAS